MSGYEGEYAIIGPPGTGKTSRIAASVKKIIDSTNTPFGTTDETPVLVCSLTRTAAREAAGRTGLPRNMVGTLHAHAYRQLDRPTMVEGKHIKEFNAEHPQYAITGAVTDKDEPEWDRTAGDLPGDQAFMELQLHRARRDPRDRWGRHVANFEEQWRRWKAENELLDFQDLIDNAIELVDTAPGNPQVVIADEAQDMSAAEFELLRKWGRAAGACILTGDPYQALYSWRGAHPEFLLSPEIKDSHRDVLSQSYRVPRAVHKLAESVIRNLSYYEEIEYAPRDEDGSVEDIHGGWQDPKPLVKRIRAEMDAGRSVMIASSCGYMLDPLTKLLRSYGVPFANPWRVANGRWNPLRGGKGSTGNRLMEFLSADPKGEDRAWTYAGLWRWVEPLAATGTLQHGMKKVVEQEATRGAQPVSFEELSEVFDPDALSELWSWIERRDTGEATLNEGVDWWLGRVASAKKKPAEYAARVVKENGVGALTEAQCWVGSIHSFKGAEADTVILLPDLSRAGYKEWCDRRNGGRDSVLRLFYVGATRARNTLLLARPSSNMSVDLRRL